MTPAEILRDFPVLTIGQVAVVLGFTGRDGRTNRKRVRELVDDGSLRLVDERQPMHRWSIAANEVCRYAGLDYAVIVAGQVAS